MIQFRIKSGSPGAAIGETPMELLVGRREDGMEVSRLFSSGFFRLWCLKRARRLIMREFLYLEDGRPNYG